MAKGKKFDAAQQHFQKKEVAMRQEVSKYRDAFVETNNVNNQLVKENKTLQEENDKLKIENAKLMELKEMSKDDLRLLIDSASVKRTAERLVNLIPGMLGRY